MELVIFRNGILNFEGHRRIVDSVKRSMQLRSQNFQQTSGRGGIQDWACWESETCCALKKYCSESNSFFILRGR
uniref:Uncharacterized protein n=1 Tax=Salix viminalis TaxID=40686 RepID=A0A6N2L3Z1_SALVM